MPNYQALLKTTINHLKTKQKVLFLTTSNRWSGESGGEMPKSTALAYEIASHLQPNQATIIEVPKLKLYACEGNVSTERGNTCGLKKALLNDKDKNPSGCHRCWASINNPDDELWKVSKELFNSDCVVFFGSIRWGQLNAHYQKLIERLTWIENRHSTLGEDNLLKDINAGIITVGQNWHGEEAMLTQKKVLDFYGFQVADELCWHWQFSNDSEEESDESYQQAAQEFQKTFLNN